jgi:hypothetical protein
MNPIAKFILLGILLGISPAAVCAALFYSVPLLIEGNAGTLLSFGVMGLFVISSVIVFVYSIILISKQKMGIVGKASLAIQILQLIALVILLQ